MIYSDTINNYLLNNIVGASKCEITDDDNSICIMVHKTDPSKKPIRIFIPKEVALDGDKLNKFLGFITKEINQG